MTPVSKIPARNRINNASKQLVINAVLLNLGDPVRGPPTKDLFEDYLDEDTLTVAQLKQKFLDSFALICSSSSAGRETASAVCLEQKQASAPILRVARNRGLSPCDYSELKKVVETLAAVAQRKQTSSHAESQLLATIVNLDQDRIESLSKKLIRAGMRQALQLAIVGPPTHSQRDRLDEGKSQLKLWIQTCPFDDGTPIGPRAASCVQWAAEARWTHRQNIQELLGFISTSPPPWIKSLHKLARYWSAIKSMVKLAVKQPATCANLGIEVVEAPPQLKLVLPNEKDLLQSTLKRLLKANSDETMHRLAQRWKTDDQERTLRKACPLMLTLHAEMQLLEFYDRNPNLVPTFKWMGTSKKACYLCYEFLLKHHLRMRVSACHQKVYPTWMPPSCEDLPGISRGDRWFAFSKRIEQETVKELKSDSSVRRRPINCDSTAGPSLTATATVRTFD